MPFSATIAMALNQTVATNITQWGLLTKSGAIRSNVAVAAGIDPETMNTAEETKSVQPVKNPRTGPKILLTQA